MHTAYLTITKASTWARWCNTKGGIVYLIRPDNYGATRASITFTASENEYKGLSFEEQKTALISRVKGSGWESERLIEEIKKTSDLYFDKVSQVKAPAYSQKLPPGIPNLVYPQSKLGVAILNKLISLAGSKFAKWLTGLFGTDKKVPRQEITLPDYRVAPLR